MRAKTVTYKNLLGETVTHTLRGKHYVEPRGYADHPGTGPKGETCATCQHCIRFRRWSKCELAQWKWTGGRGSDILARAPACKLWVKQNHLGLTDATVLTEKEFLKLMQEIKNP